jgi:uncharacterized protein (UPF0335 family)
LLSPGFVGNADEGVWAVEYADRALARRRRLRLIRGSMEWSDTGMAEQGVAGEQLRAFVERIERLEEEKKAIADDIKEVYAEAKGNGFDSKVMRKLVSIRKQDRAERLEQEAILDLYMHALGMVIDGGGVSSTDDD